MEITEEIQAKVLLPYVGQEVKIPDGSIHVLTGIHKHNERWWFSFGGNYNHYLRICYCCLIVKPLWTITDEDILACANIDEITDCEIKKEDRLVTVSSTIDGELYELKIDTRDCFIYLLKSGKNVPLLTASQMYDYLKSKGYDLPNHLLGGSKLYDSDLACHYESIYKINN